MEIRSPFYVEDMTPIFCVTMFLFSMKTHSKKKKKVLTLTISNNYTN